MEKQILDLQQQNEALRLEKHIMEKNLRAEIQRLQDQVEQTWSHSRGSVNRTMGVFCTYVYLFFSLPLCCQVSTVVQSNLKLSEELKQYRSVGNCQQRVNQLVRTGFYLGRNLGKMHAV